jgi:putative SOS response-associated peptidase YedK
MCGRYRLTSNADIVAEMFGLATPAAVETRPEFFPTNAVSALRLGEQSGEREIATFRWGLIPRWAREEMSLFNARAETLLEKPSFRDAFRSRRCLIPADGFFEWPVVDGKKRKTLIQRRDHRPFAFAGLWERWQSKADGRVIESCTIITSEPNDFMQAIHNRMPVIVDRASFARWIARDSRAEDLLSELLRPSEWPGMEATAAT